MWVSCPCVFRPPPTASLHILPKPACIYVNSFTLFTPSTLPWLHALPKTSNAEDGYSKTSVHFYQTTCRRIPYGSTINGDSHENLKSHTVVGVWEQREIFGQKGNIKKTGENYTPEKVRIPTVRSTLCYIKRRTTCPVYMYLTHTENSQYYRNLCL